MKRSQWMAGLLYGENLAQKGYTSSDIKQHVEQHIFARYDDFFKGVMAYASTMPKPVAACHDIHCNSSNCPNFYVVL